MTDDDADLCPQLPAGVFEFVVDTVDAGPLLRPRGETRRTGHTDLVWRAQHEDERGLAADDPERPAPPMTLALWNEPRYRPTPRQGLPEGQPPGPRELHAPLLLPAFRYVLRNVPPLLADYLTTRRQVPGHAHEGYQVKLWLDPQHRPPSAEARVWLWVFLLDVYPQPRRAPEPSSPALSALWGTLGNLPDRAAGVSRQEGDSRMVSEELVTQLTTVDPPPVSLPPDLSPSADDQR